VGGGGLQRALSQLEGFEAAVGSWEHDLLPARMEYGSAWLDQLFGNGEVVWGRLQPPKLADDSRGQVLTRVSPIALLRRADLSWLLPPERAVPVGMARWDAQTAYDALVNHGALFFDDLLAVTKLLPSQLEDALRELAALGLVTSDGFAAVRGLCSKSRHTIGRRARRAKHRNATYSQGGRWSRFPPFVQPVSAEDRAARWAWLLLRRYGVMFRDLLTRESAAPAWRELLPLYRRLEMRGEIRGGRFVVGVAGEQFALPEAVEQLRKHRDNPTTETWSVISAVDPINLVGIVTRDARVPAIRGNRIVLLNGQAIAAREARAIRWLRDADEATRQRAERLLTTPGAIRRDLVANGGVRALADAASFEPGAMILGNDIVRGRNVVRAPAQ
jgi:ATP-dependent Lhr-like helicase